MRPGDAVLVKASRAVGLERVADELVTREHASVIALLIAGGVAFAVTVLGTPLLIRVLRSARDRPADPRRRPDRAPARGEGRDADDGRHRDRRRRGARLPRRARPHRAAQVRAHRADAACSSIVGLAVVGFVDDYLGVRRGRNLGLRKRGQDRLASSSSRRGFALLALDWVDVSTHLSFTRPLDLDLGTSVWFVFAVVVVYGTANAVNLTDGLDGLAAGSATLVFAAFMIICFRQFRHPTSTASSRRRRSTWRSSRPRSPARAAASCGGTRRRRGSSWATPARSRSAARWPASRCSRNTVLLLPILGGLYVVETLSVIAQVISFRGFRRRVLRMAPIHHHFEVGGWPEFTVIVRFWLFAGVCVALGDRHLLRRLHQHPGSDRLMRVLVIGLGGDRRRGRAPSRARAATT